MVIQSEFFTLTSSDSIQRPILPYHSSKLGKWVWILAAGIQLFSMNLYANADKPNIVIFFADDAGYSDFGFQQSKTHITPNIDQLATEGMVFTDAYATSSVCSASRAGILTGRYQNRFGFEFNIPNHLTKELESVAGLPQWELTFGELAKQQGYRTALIGKWHLGSAEKFLPENNGFDRFFGILGGSSGYHPGKAKRVVSNYKKIIHNDLPYLTDAFGDEAVDFIRSSGKQPFLLYMPFTAPHSPMHAKPDLLEHYQAIFDDKRRAANAALTESMDHNIGKVVSALKELGLYHDTLIVFTNDNGGAGSANGAENTPLTGAKGTVLEGGIKVPLILSWPAVLPQRNRNSLTVSLLDILPTIVAAMGADLPPDRPYDGIELISQLKDPSLEVDRNTLYWRVNWAAAIRQDNWKLIRTPTDTHYLFNLQNDPGETQDLLITESGIAEALKLKLATWENEMMPSLWGMDEKWKRSATLNYDVLTQ